MKVYAVKNKDDSIRLKSSSGGIFTALAEHIIEQGGSVIGAAWDELDVKHIKIDNKEDLTKLRKSKYVRSTVNYKLITNELTLFSGTPCQMTKPKENLYQIDFICHGTPTKEAFNKYCADNGIIDMDFRDKEEGWTNFKVRYELSNGEIVLQPFQNNEFMQDFLGDKNLCASCYNCQFKNFKSNSDIMLGDFWGIGNEYPDFADNKGVSAVFIKTLKGELLFDKIKDKIDYIEVDINKVIKYNPSVVKSAERG